MNNCRAQYHFVAWGVRCWGNGVGWLEHYAVLWYGTEGQHGGVLATARLAQG
jgi:hypothetical protein